MKKNKVLLVSRMSALPFRAIRPTFPLSVTNAASFMNDYFLENDLRKDDADLTQCG
jgi:hypothetical protein